MEITVKETTYIEKYTRWIDRYYKVKVGELAFKQGELYYFRKFGSRFEFVVVSYDSKENVYCL